MRIARLKISRFRGFDYADIGLTRFAVFVGEPQSGRTDIVEALHRVLNPSSTRVRVNPVDIHRPPGDNANEFSTSVEVVILDLGSYLESIFHEYLEPFNEETGELANQATASDAVPGLRLCYRAHYDVESDLGDHWVDFPSKSDPESSVFRKASQAERRALPVHFIDDAPALQVRAEGNLRSLLSTVDSGGLKDALSDLTTGIGEATHEFTQHTPLPDVVSKVLNNGVADLFRTGHSIDVAFQPEDGTLAALLRLLQPAVSMDAAGTLPLTSHGSTLGGVVSIGESLAGAIRSAGGLIIIGDDFGDNLDASSAEHMAGLVRRNASQAILTTRRPEVVRVFGHNELHRLTGRHTDRKLHRLPTASTKSDRVLMRLVLEQLQLALTCQTIILVEGPHDLEAYNSLSARLAERPNGTRYSLSANRSRIVSPPGSDGGLSRLPAIARLASELGFKVRAIVDNDKPNLEDPAIGQLEGLVEQLIVLQARTAIEAALIRGLPAKSLRATVNGLAKIGTVPDLEEVEDTNLADFLISTNQLRAADRRGRPAHRPVGVPR